jgi:hypothetical protein
MERALDRPTPRNPIARLLSAADRRMLVILLVVVAASVALRLLTWNVIADGGQSRYVKTVGFGAVAAVCVWVLVRVQTPDTSWLPLICAAAVLLAGDGVHYARLLNPITRGGPVVQLAASFPNEATTRRQWEFDTSNGGSVQFESGAVRLVSPPGGAAFMLARLGVVPDVRVSWWLPVGLAEREREETFSWRAKIERTGGYYVVTELRQLLIQAVSYGIHITYPDERNQARGYEIPHPAGSDGAVHDWQIRRTSQQISVDIDDKQVWSAPQRGELNQAKLGETKTDAAHAGSMRVESASYKSVLEGR